MASETLSRRDFLRAVGKTATAIGAASLVTTDRSPQRITRLTSPVPETQERSIASVYPLPANYDYDLNLPPQNELRAADGSFSTKLPDGRQFVVYGDTRTQNESRRNTAALVDVKKGTYTILAGANGLEWVSPKKDSEEDRFRGKYPKGTYYWPLPPYVDNNLLYVPLARQGDPQSNDPNRLAGEHIGTDIARFNLNGNIPQLETITSLPRIDHDNGTVTTWGAATMQHPSEPYDYIFGSTQDLLKKSLHWKELRLARALKGQTDNANTWEFWDGTTWLTEKDGSFVQNESKAIALISDSEGLSAGFSVNAIDGKFVLVNKDFELFPNAQQKHSVGAFVADSPTGLWRHHELLTLPDYTHAPGVPTNIQVVNYLAFAHPEAQNPHRLNDMLITVCSNIIAPALPEEPNEQTTRRYFNAVNALPEDTRIKSFWVSKKKLLA